jgi:cytochrome c-L
MTCRIPLSLFLLAAPLLLVGATKLARAEIEFRHALDNSPLEIKPRANEVETEAVKEFKASGKNQYGGDEAALTEGKKLYLANCQACHLPDGSGRLGPSLISNTWIRERAATDIGMFEIIYGGSSGAMQSFARRGMTQDQMLKIIAYVRSLKKV